MLHIAVFLPSLRGGGAERISVTLANQLALRGHHVDLVVAQGGGAYASEVSSEVHTIDLGRSRVSRALAPLVEYLKREKPDVLLGVMSHSNAIALAAAALSGVRTKVIVTEHNSARVRRTPLMFQAIRRCLYPYAHAVVAVSNGIREELIVQSKLSADKVVTVYNPLDIEAIERLAKEKFASPWDADGTPFAVAVGSLQPQKDFATLIRAVALVNRTRPLRLAVLGQGPQRDELEALAKEQSLEKLVHFAGFQANPFVWMRHADMFVLSSRWEGLPGVLLEALSVGTRVVSTNCPTGPHEILEGGRWGALVPPADPEALAAGMLRALTSAHAPESGLRARDFDMRVAVDRYEQLFRAGPTSMDPVQT